MTAQAGAESGQESTSTTTGTGQESTGQQGGTGQESAQQGTQQGGASGFDLSSIQDPALRGYLEAQQRDTQEARQEAARYRTELRTVQAAEQTRVRASETAEQTSQREQQENRASIDSLTAENRDLKVGAAVRTAASAAKAFNSETVWQMVKDRVQLNEAGQPANLDVLLADLKRTDGYLFQRGRATADAGDGGGSPTLTMNDRIRAARSRGSIQEE